MKTIKLARGERIVAVVPEHCSGPGWRNSVVWVYVMCPDTTVFQICLQHSELPSNMLALFDVGAVVCAELKRAVPCVVDDQEGE